MKTASFRPMSLSHPHGQPGQLNTEGGDQMKRLADWLTTPPDAADKPCWKEVIDSAMAGFCPTGEQLERLLDRLERRS